MRSAVAPSLAWRPRAHRLRVGAKKGGKGQRAAEFAAGGAPPPPPPTVEPPPSRPNKPKERSAYRQRRRSSEEREAARAAAVAAAVRAAGHTHYLDAQALQQRHAAALLSQGRQQPLPGAGGDGAATLLVIDGYNFLHSHPSTKSLIESGNRIDEARALLHKLLRAHADASGVDMLVVYDATTVGARGAGGGDRTVPVGPRVSALFRAGRDADSVIIECVQELHARSAAAAAAGLPASSAPRLRVRVVTNDRRIAADCNDPVLFGGGGGGSVICQTNRQLSEELQRLERSMAAAIGGGGQLRAAQAAAAAERLAGALPDRDHDTRAWAAGLLSRARAQSQQPAAAAAAAAAAKRTRRGGPQEPPPPLPSDEELLQRAAAASAAAAPQPPLAAGAAGPPPPPAPCGDGGAPQPAPAVASTTQQLDDLLSADLDDLLSDD